MRKILFILTVVLLWPIFAYGLSADPLEIGVGARPLGMGRAFVAMPNNLFVNPAGVSDFNIISMSGTLLQEVSYKTLGLAYPFALGTLGFGYIGSGIGSISLTRVVGTTIEVYDSSDYANNVFVMSYALPFNKINFIPKFDFVNKVSIGTSLKYYVQGFSNLSGSLEGATGTGMDLDFALFYRPDSQFSIGVNLQNALPVSMGGKFTWKRNGIEEGIPAVLKIGGAVNFLDKKLTLALDSDTYLTKNKPGVWHVGLEWWPVEILVLRFGLDQTSSAVQISNDLTFGVGIKFRGFTFDYAYHQYGDVSENATSYFSLGYVGESKEPVKEIVPTARIKRMSFKDVSPGYWARDPIEYLAAAGVISGYPDGTFRPEKTLSRAELCTLLIKAKAISAAIPKEAPFPDLPADHWAARYVRAAADLKLVGGYPDGTFRPANPLSRAEAVKILAVFDGLKTAEVVQKPFPDVPLNHWAASYIQAARAAGILDYLKGKEFEPTRELTRAEAAEMIFRTSFGKAKVKGF